MRLLSSALLVVLAMLLIWIGLVLRGWDRVWGLGGGVAVLVAVGLAVGLAPSGSTRQVARVLFVLAVVPLAVSTWWSLVTPVLALLVVVLGVVLVGNLTRPPAPSHR